MCILYKMASYEDVENRMKNYIVNADNDETYRMFAIDWFNNFNPTFYPQMLECVNILNNDDVDRMPEIKKLGNDLNNFGGKDMMVSMYYIMSNFMGCRYMIHFNLQWNNIGEWKY